MTEYGTIKIPHDAYQRHNEHRQELGLTWEEYIDGTAPQHDVPDAEEVGAVVAMTIRTDLEEAARQGARQAVEEFTR